MSQIACCPACQTCYVVTVDQLRLSRGWVRCGQCGEVFDAAQQLALEQRVAPAPQVPEPAAAMAASSEAPRERVTSSATAVAETVPNPGRSEFAAPGLDEAGNWDSASLLSKPSADSADAGPGPDVPAPERAAAPAGHMQAAASNVPAGEAGVASATPTFVAQAASVKRSRRGWWRLSVVVLVLGLVTQVLYRERDQLAAHWPVLKAPLQSVCGLLGCRVSPLQRTEALSIDAAALQRLGPEFFRLSLKVKNTSPFELAVPAIELTLTDTADQPILRKVLRPADLEVDAQVLAAGGEWPVSATFRVAAGVSLPAALGYRLLAFYP